MGETESRRDLRSALEAWSSALLQMVPRFDADPLVAEVRSTGSVLRQPTTEAQIGMAEQRLGLQLPESYRDFLLISNGTYASPGWIDRCGEVPNGFLEVEKVVPLREAMGWLVDIWTEEWNLDPSRAVHPSPGVHVEPEYYQPFADSLLIVAQTNQNPVLLAPVQDGRWEYWYMHKEGAVAYWSLPDLLNDELQRCQAFHEWHRAQPLTPEEALAQALDSSTPLERIHVWKVAQVDADLAAGIAARVAGDRTMAVERRAGSLSLLSRMAWQGMVVDEGVLRRCASASEPPLIRMEALFALHWCGDPEAEGGMRELAAAERDFASPRSSDYWLAQLHAWDRG